MVGPCSAAEGTRPRGTCTEVLPDACRWWIDAGRVGRLRGVAGLAEQRHRGPGAGWPCGVDRAPVHGLGDRCATRRLVSARHRFSHLSSPICAPPSPTKPARGGTSTTVLTDYRIRAATHRSTRRREFALRPSEMKRDAFTVRVRSGASWVLQMPAADTLEQPESLRRAEQYVRRAEQYVRRAEQHLCVTGRASRSRRSPGGGTR